MIDVPRVVQVAFFMLLTPLTAFSAEGRMGIVTGNPGKIMEGTKVLAEVPQGTSLWIFSEKLGWAEVKAPNGEQHGWMLLVSMEPAKLTDQQQADHQLAKIHFEKAAEQKKVQQYKSAQQHMEQGLALERRLYPEHPNLADTLNKLGSLAIDQGNYPAARKYYDEALAIQRKVLGNEHISTADSLNILGNLVSDQGDYPAARKYYDEALAIKRKVLGNEHTSTAMSLNNLGKLANDQGDYPAARKYYEEALAIKRKVLGNEHPSTAITLNNLGNLDSDQGNNVAARQYYNEALAIQQKKLGNEHASTADTLNNLGNLARTLGDYPIAGKYYDEALAIKRKVLGSDHPSTASTLNNLGILVSDQGDYPAARKYYDEALAIKRKVLGSEHPSTTDTLNNLGNLASEQGDYPAARKYYDEALASNRKVLGNEHPRTALSLNSLGVLAHDQGDFSTARKYFEDALAIERKVLGNEHPKTALALNNLGVVAHDQGDYSTARKYFDEALASLSKVLGNEHPSTANILNNLGDLARDQGDHLAAAEFYDQNRRIIRKHVQHTLPGLTEAEQVRFLDNRYLRNWTRQLSCGWNQRETPEILARSASWLMNGKAVAQESLAARVLLARDATNPQLAPLVKDLIAARQQLSTIALSTPLPSEGTTQQKELAQLTRDEQRLARVIAQVTGLAPAERDWYELDDVRAAIPADAVFVDLVRMAIHVFNKDKFSPPHYLAWITPAKDHGAIQIIDLGEAAPIEAAVVRARTSLANAAAVDSVLRKEGEVAASAQATKDLQVVADLVLKPLLPHLGDKKQLILSPDGALWLLPWAALPVAENKCLLEQCSIRYVLSGRDLAKKEGTNKLPTSAPAIFTNPDFDLAGQAAKAAIKAILPQATFDEATTRGIVSKSSLPRVSALPFTAVEGQTAEPILAKLAGSEPQSFQQEKALEAVAKNLKRPKHLLFATHGFFLPDQEIKLHDDKLLASSDTRASPALTTDGKRVENPLLRCGLLLAGCNSPRTTGLDDGILTGMEIVGMDLRGTELVVLSACETGLGKVRNGEGVAGLRQAFQLAGAQSVVSTLWQVPDRDSAIIMQDFFTDLATGQSKADALRNAQLKRIVARKEKSGAAHPFFWAAWTVTGE